MVNPNKEENLLWQLWGEVDELSAQQALEDWAPRAMALLAELLEGRRVFNVLTAVQAGRLLYKQVMLDRARLLKLERLTTDMVDTFATLTLALWQVDTNFQLSLPATKKSLLKKTVQRAWHLRKRLLAAAVTVWEGQENVETQIAEIRKGTGYPDLAGDHLAIVTLCRQRINEVLAIFRQEVIEAWLTEAEKLARTILDLLQDSTAEPLTDKEETQDLRLRLFVLFENTYNELARGGRYLYEGVDEKLVELYAPLSTAIYRLTPPSAPAPKTPADKPVTPGSSGESPTPTPTPGTPQ